MTKFGVLDVEGTKYTLKLGEAYLVGVKSNNYAHDIEIEDESVDIKHCILDFTKRSPKLLDIRSKCGTYVDGKRVNVCRPIPLVKSTAIQFGNVEATLHLLNECDSGYLEGRLSPPPKDNSDITCKSPENDLSTSCGLQNTSTPNATNAKSNCIQNAVKPIADFLVPIGVPRRSAASNTSSRSSDSFCIPETQYPVQIDGKNNSISSSFGDSKSKEKENDVEDDFYIPETQEFVCPTNTLSNYPRVAFENEDINETVLDGDKIPSSQFHICTQDFNGTDDDLSNNSEDILANIPCSLVIPVIRHSAVQIDDFADENDEEDIEKEMSALQWSKSVAVEEGSISPDNIISEAVTPDLIFDLEEGTKKPVSQRNTPDIFGNVEQAELPVISKNVEKSVNENKSLSQCNTPDIFVAAEGAETLDNTVKSFNEKIAIPNDIGPTQVFVKPPLKNEIITKPFVLSCDKENIGPEKDDILFLPATQVFMPPPDKKKPVILSSPILPQPPNQASLVTDDDDLPPTQVFQKPVSAASITSNQINGFSSIVVDSVMQLSETSFKAKCNKLLDSDDDEMDELIAPELVKKMREPLKKPEEVEKTISKSITDTSARTSIEKSSNEKDQASTSREKPINTPKNKYLVSTVLSKKYAHLQPTVSIDNFMYTPDFLGHEFSKDEQLHKLAELDWKNMISEKQRKALFGDDDSDEHQNPVVSDSDYSQDSFDDLLPYKKDRERMMKSVPNQTTGNKDKPKQTKVPIEHIGVRTRNQKSAFPDKTKEKKGPRKIVSKSKVEPDKKEIKSKKISKKEERKMESIGENELILKVDALKGCREKNDDLKQSHEKSNSPSSEQVKKHETFHREKNEQEKDRKKKENRAQKTEEDSITSAPKRTTRHVPIRLGKHKAAEENQIALPPKRATRHSSIDLNRNEAAKSKHHKYSNCNQDHSSNSDQHQAIINDHNRIHHKEPIEKLIKAITEKNDTKQLRSSDTNSTKSSTKSTKEKKEEEENPQNKRKHKSQEVSKIKNTEASLPRQTRLRRVQAPLLQIESAVELTDRKRIHRQEKNGIKTSSDMLDSPEVQFNFKKEKSSNTIDLTESDSEDIVVEAPRQNKKSKTTNQSSSKTLSTRTTSEKRKKDIDETKTKRIRSSNDTRHSICSPPKIKIAMTMCHPKNQEIVEKYSGALWIYAKDPKECDILVVEKGLRTYKLIVAIARGIPIVTLNWIHEVITKRTVAIPFENYIFEDPKFQERNQFNMRKSLHLAKTTSLLDGIGFLMTPNIRPAPEEMEDIITCAGGTVLKHIPKPQINQRIYLVSTPTDTQHWHRFRRSNSNIKVVSTEGVMACVMQQSEKPLIKSIIE